MRAWTNEERRMALGLYYRMPFGQIHSRNSVIVRVAEGLSRTPSSLAMKMLNFASLDPLIRESGRSGLGNASDGDRLAWDAFAAHRADAVEEVEQRLEKIGVAEIPEWVPPGETETVRLVKQRRGQRFFRASVMASYGSTCCMSGITDPRLLIASHIVPWRHDEQARLDPRNGLCLSNLHDRLFDAGIITVGPDFRIIVSSAYVKSRTDDFSRQHIHALHDVAIDLPQKFAPLVSYLDYHNRNVFDQNGAAVDRSGRMDA